jgi:hypothetical protein
LLSFWQLIGFEDTLDTWISIGNPCLDLRILVTEWGVGRADDLYTGVTRRLEIAPDFWFGVVPGSREGDRRALSLRSLGGIVDRIDACPNGSFLSAGAS